MIVVVCDVMGGDTFWPYGARPEYLRAMSGCITQGFLKIASHDVRIVTYLTRVFSRLLLLQTSRCVCMRQYNADRTFSPNTPFLCTLPGLNS
jgi:purine nucleoside permease